MGTVILYPSQIQDTGQDGDKIFSPGPISGGCNGTGRC